MAYAVAGRALQHDGVFDRALARRCFQDDVFDAVTNLKYLSAKLRHGRAKQQVLVFAFHIQGLFDL